MGTGTEARGGENIIGGARIGIQAVLELTIKDLNKYLFGLSNFGLNSGCQASSLGHFLLHSEKKFPPALVRYN